MNTIFNVLVSLIVLTFVSSPGFSQPKEIKITLIGNCGLYMTDGTLDMYTDFPYKSGAHNYMEYDPSELDNITDSSIFIFTHTHTDHYSRKLVKNVLKTKKGKKYGPGNVAELERLSEPIPDFSIQAFKTKHRFSFNHYSYLITWHGKKIFLSGDTEHAETIGGIKDLDWAFVPTWLILDAREKGIEIDTEMIGVYHIGPGDKVTSSRSDILLLDKQGAVISIQY